MPPPAIFSSVMRRHAQRLGVARAAVLAQQQPHRDVGGKLGRAPHAAVGLVEGALEVADRLADQRGDPASRVGSRRRGRLHLLAHRARPAPRRRARRARVADVGLGEVAEQLEEAVARAARPVARREIGPAEERLALGRQPDAHRPAARLGQRLHGGHVDRVDVGPLLAVDLDADVVAVHEGGDLLVLERLPLHDVAPVAGGVADRQEDRPPEPPRLVERLVAPGPPVDRVVRVLQQIRARLEDQPVGVLRRLADEVVRARPVTARRGLTPGEGGGQLRRQLGRVGRCFGRRRQCWSPPEASTVPRKTLRDQAGSFEAVFTYSGVWTEPPERRRSSGRGWLWCPL